MTKNRLCVSVAQRIEVSCAEIMSLVTGSVYGVVRVVGEPRDRPKVDEEEFEWVEEEVVLAVDVRDIVEVEIESRRGLELRLTQSDRFGSALAPGPIWSARLGSTLAQSGRF